MNYTQTTYTCECLRLKPKLLTRKLCYRKDDRAMRAIEVDRGGRHLEFVQIENSAIRFRSAVPENPTL